MSRRAVVIAGVAALAAALGACAGQPKPKATVAPARRAAAPPPAARDRAGAPRAKAAKPPWTDVFRRIAPPPARPARALPLPPLTRKTLSNGLGVLLMPERSLPLVTVQLLVRAGSRDDPAGKVGLADFTAGMLRLGTRGLSAEAISERVDRAGARLGASAGYEFSRVSCAARAAKLDLCLDLVRRLAVEPTFPAAEMTQVKNQLLASVREARDDPATLATLHFENLLYGDDHPAGRPLTAAGIERITRADLVRFHRRYYRPRGAWLAISGDVDAAVVRKVARAFRRWRGRQGAHPRHPLVKDPPPGLHVLLVDKPSLTQSFFTLGHAGIPVTHPDRDAVRVMNYVLGGGGFSSRLMKVVRSEGGKTYGISSRFAANGEDGDFRVRTFTRTPATVSTLLLVLNELKRIQTSPPVEEEVRAAKGKIAGGYALRFQRPARLAGALLEAALRGLPPTYVSELPLRVDRVTVADTARVARAHVRPGRLVVAIVGDAKAVGRQLDEAGIRYERIDYLAPISRRARARRAEAASRRVTPAELRRGRALLRRIVRAMGGERRWRRLATLRLAGKVTFVAGPGKGGGIEGRIEELLAWPDRLRVAVSFGGRAGMVQALNRGRGVLKVPGAPARPVPPAKVAQLALELRAHPLMALKTALDRGTRLRPAKDEAGRLAVEVLPSRGPPFVLVAGPDGKLVELRLEEPGGARRRVTLASHARAGGLLLPRRVTIASGGKEQRVAYEVVEVNPRLDPAVFDLR